MSITHTIHRQFGHPAGLIGRLAGRVMATRGSNLERSRRTVDLLDVQPGHRVLEVGHGPGVALTELVERVGDGSVVGLDHSELMHSQADRRNGAAVEAGRLILVVGQVEDLDPTLRFDRIMLVNVAMFWVDPATTFRHLADHLVPGGVLAVTHQPRDTGADETDTDRATDELTRHVQAAGLTLLAADRLDVGGVPAVCLRATTTDDSGRPTVERARVESV